MMLDRLQVADLKDEIVGMQIDLNQILYETHSDIVGKTEMQQQQNQNMQSAQTTSSVQYQPIHQAVPSQTSSISVAVKAPQSQSTQQPTVQQYQMHQQPSQIIKAKQEMKLMENFKSEQIKIELPETEKKPSFSNVQHNQQPLLNHIQMPALVSPKNTSRGEKPPKSPVKGATKVTNQKAPQVQQKDLKKELENFDIESEITPSFIMKKCETYNYHNMNNNQQLQNNPSNPPAMTSHTRADKVSNKKSHKIDEFPMDYFGDNSHKDKGDGKMEPYDEWLSIQTELNMQLTSVKETNIKHDRKQHPSLSTSVVKSVENELNDIFEQHSSPKSVEKQLDDLFNNPSKSIIGTESPLAELFNASTIVTEKSVENRLEALFESDDEESMAEKANVDLVETRLEQLFQGSGSANDESALDNHSFLYKSSDLTYDMIQQQMHANATGSVSITTNTASDTQQSNKRQWNNPGCDMLYGNQLASPPQPTKRPCISTPQYDTSKWMIDDTFGFGSLGACDNAEILHETSGDETTKRHWNGDIMDLEHGPSKKNCYNPEVSTSKMNHCNTLQGDNHSILQHHTSMSDSVIVQHNHQQQHFDEMHHFEHLHHQSPSDANSTASAGTSLPINFEDDINRQVQNAIDSILNLQGSEPDSLQFSLDQTMGTFLENSMISSTSVINPTASSTHQLPQQQQQGFSQNFQQRQTIISKRKYTNRLDDIGDCLIGGSSNLDDSPSSSLSLAHIDGPSGSDFGGANSLMDEAVKSIITS